MGRVKLMLRRADDLQRRVGPLGFAVAVIKRFGEDRAGQLAALIAYYGFFSLFPLLLALVTLAGLVVSDAGTQTRIVDAALAQFPVIGDQLRANVHRLPAKGLALTIGLAGALWAGLGGVKAAQNAMDFVWDVPIKRQPNFVKALGRAVAMIATLGVFLVLASFLGGIAAGSEDAPLVVRVVGVIASGVLNVAIFLVAFRVLTVEDVRWSDVFPGAVVAGVSWSVLQAAGVYILGSRLESAASTYGFFAVVIGLLTWIYLAAQMTLLAAEINVVRARRLWPRSLVPEDLTSADRRALAQHAAVEERREEERVSVRFEPPQADEARSR